MESRSDDVVPMAAAALVDGGTARPVGDDRVRCNGLPPPDMGLMGNGLVIKPDLSIGVLDNKEDFTGDITASAEIDLSSSNESH